jgi:NitT/TauT family transport system ATP-binding protein
VRGLGTTSVLVTHRLEEALEMADRVVVLGAPARVLAEIRTDATERADPVRLGALRRAVAEILERGDHPAT